MNMQLRQCFSRAKPFRLRKARNCQILSGFFYFQKSQTCSKKARISKSGVKKDKMAHLAMSMSNLILYVDKGGYSLNSKMVPTELLPEIAKYTLPFNNTVISA